MHRLYIGTKFTGITVRQDERYPTMWRVHHGDRVSDMVNLSRAKDAAISWATPKAGGIADKVSWKAVVVVPGRSQTAQTGSTLVGAPTALENP